MKSMEPMRVSPLYSQRPIVLNRFSELWESLLARGPSPRPRGPRSSRTWYGIRDEANRASRQYMKQIDGKEKDGERTREREKANPSKEGRKEERERKREKMWEARTRGKRQFYRGIPLPSFTSSPQNCYSFYLLLFFRSISSVRLCWRRTRREGKISSANMSSIYICVCGRNEQQRRGEWTLGRR